MISAFNLDHQHQDVDSKITAALERLSQAFKALLWEKNKTNNLSPIQIQLLVHLLFHDKKQMTIGLLAKEFKLTAATISDAITSMEKKKLVARQKSSKDRRIVSIRLTEEGREGANKLSDWANIIQLNLTEFDPEKKIVVMQFLMELIESLQKAGVISVARMCVTCKNFKAGADAQTPHYCNLMDKPLASSELRLDCPDHEILLHKN